MTEQTRRRRGAGLMRDVWSHPWGRVLIVALTVAVVSWAIRETAAVTFPVIEALGAILVPLLIGFTVAYVLTPLVDAISRHGVRRLVATFILFFIFIVVGSLTLAFGVPAIINQSMELAARTVEDQPFLDRDGDGVRMRHEPILRRLPGTAHRFFHDLDEDTTHSGNEPVYVRGSDSVAISPSMARHVLSWLGEQQERVERYVGTDLDPASATFLEFYRQRTTPFRQVLDDGLRKAISGVPRSLWPAALKVDAAELTNYDAPWNRAWPGVLPEDFEAAAEVIPDEQSRLQWRSVMSRYGQAYIARHQQLLAAWRILQEREVAGDAARPSIDESLPIGLRLDALLQQEHADILAGQLRQWLTRSDVKLENDAVATQLRTFVDSLHDARDAGLEYAVTIFRSLEADSSDPPLMDSVLESLGGQIRNNLQALSADVTSGLGQALSVGGVLTLALDLVLIPIYAFFLTLAMPTLRGSIDRALPDWNRETILRILHDIERVVAAFFRGRLIVCLLCSILVAVGFLIGDVPYAVLFGLAIGLATTVPLSGLLFLIPAVLLTVIEHPDDPVLYAGIAVGVYTVVQTLEMTVFTPMIMGREVELHPVMLIIALLFFGKIMGVIGVILAVPIAASLRILAREFLIPYIRRTLEQRQQTVWETVTGMISRTRVEEARQQTDSDSGDRFPADDGSSALERRDSDR